jgi:1-acyl-sn-glycerol-3-phosphate acyltransferase
MLQTILYALYFTITLILTLIVYVPYPILKILKRRRAVERYVGFIVPAWARNVVWMTGARVTVTGLENLPKDRTVCFIANHQGNFDIPMILGYLRRKIGFITKIELTKIPILTLWMKALHCIFIDRKELHQSLRKVQKGIRAVHEGHNLLIFPEGTRSRSAQMGPFKRGGLQMAIEAGAPIVPLTVNGCYHLFEEKGRIHRSPLTLHAHPLIETASLSKAQQEELPQKLYDQIAAKLVGE